MKKGLLPLLLLLIAHSAFAQITNFSYTGSMQFYTVPVGVTNITVTARGAQGGFYGAMPGGNGALVQGDIAVTPGQVLKVLVGQQGGTAYTGGGGGGSFVTTMANAPLVIAGGGGGASITGAIGQGGQITNNGGSISTLGELGGVGGNGGDVGLGNDGCGGVGHGGGGLLGDGGGIAPAGGKAFVNGGAGGVDNNVDNCVNQASGGYGGGGAGANGGGGGGGYSGGAGGSNQYDWMNGTYPGGGGGGSYNAGTNQLAAIGVNSGNGSVSICVGTNPPAAVTGPSSVVCVGSTISLSDVTAGGTWLSGNTTIASVNNIGTVTGVGAGTSSIIYTLSAGCVAGRNVTVSPGAIVYTVTGGGGYCAGGAGALVGLSGSEVGVNYQLYFAGVVPMGGTVAGTGGPLSFGPQPFNGNYTVVAIMPVCGNVNMNGSVTVTQNPLPTQYNLTGGGNYCSGGAGVAIGLSNSQTGVSYQLYQGASPSGPAVMGSTGLAISFGNRTTAGSYTVIATNTLTSCQNNMLGSATVTIDPLPTAYSVTGGGTYCTGGSGFPVGLNFSNTGISYQLYHNGNPVGAPLTGIGAPLSFGTQYAGGSYTVVATNVVTNCVETMVGSATIVENALPVAYNVTGGGTYCAGGTGVLVGIDNSETTVNYQLYVGGVPTGAPMTGTGGAFDFGLQTAAGVYTVVGTNNVTGCVGNLAGSVTIAIQPLPTVVSVAGNVTCAGTASSVSGSASAGAGINWYDASTGGTLVGSGNVLPVINPMVTTDYYAEAYDIVTTSLASLFASNNNQSGAMFDLTAINNLDVTSFDVSTFAGTYDFEVYYRTNSMVGNDVSPAGWILAGTYPSTFLPSDGNRTFTLPSPISIPAGQTYGFYITSTVPSAGVVKYTNGTGVGNVFSANSDIQIREGYGSQYPFAGSFSPRMLNFQVNYSTGAVVGCVSATRSMATLTVNQLPAVPVVAASGIYCDSTTITADNGSDGVMYFQGTTSGGTSTATPSTSEFITASGTYYFRALSVDGCWGPEASVTITINPRPNVFNVIGGGAYCAGDAGVLVLLDGSEAGVDYQLYEGVNPVGMPMAGTGMSINFGFQTVGGTYTVVATNSVTLCTKDMNSSATVIVNPVPVVYNVTGGGPYCYNSGGSLVGLDNSEVGVNYQLYDGMTAIGSPVAGTGSAISFGQQPIATTYTVIATNATTGCVSNMAGSATVTINPIPVVFTVTGGGSYCVGDAGLPIGLTNSVVGINYQLYNGLTPVGMPLAGTGSALDFGLQTVVGSYTVVAIDAITGCSSNMTSSAVIVMNPLPAVYATTGGGNFCTGGAGVNVGLLASNTGISYQLYVGAMPVGSPITGVGTSINFGLQTIPGIYTIVATNTITGCTSTMSGSAVVVADPLPVAYNVTGGGIYCAGGAGVSVGLDNSDMGIYYALYNGASLVGTWAGTGAALDFGLQAGTGVYTVIATDATTGCTSNMNMSAVVSANPAPTAYNVTGSGSYCAGGTGLSIGLNYSDVGIDYQLYLVATPVGAPLAGTGAALDFGLQTAGGSYSVLATNTLTGCTGFMANTAFIVVNPLVTPDVILSITPGDTVCAGTTTIFTATPINGGMSPSYEWFVNGTTTGVTVNSYSYVPADGDIVKAVINSSDACASPVEGMDSVTMNVIMNQTPAVAVSVSSNDTVCNGSSVVFTATPSYGGDAPMYTWFLNGGNVGTSATYSYTPTNGDIVYAQMVSNYRCITTANANSNNVTMTVTDAMIPVVIIEAHPGLSIRAGQSDTLKAVVVSGGSNPKYQWYKNGATIAGATSALYISNNFVNKDSVSCVVTNTDACGLYSFNSIFIRVSTVGIAAVTGEAEVMVLPNPNKGAFTVKGTLGNATTSEVTFEITNMLGQVVYSSNATALNGVVNTQIQLSKNLANGMYLLNMRSGAESKVFHIVVEQ